jgi:hypothetical protein
VLSAIGLGAREVNAFGDHVRYRLYRTANGNGWPTQATAERAIREIDAELRVVLRATVRSGRLSPLDAEALHRRLRWVRFSKRFAGDVDYREEQR